MLSAVWRRRWRADPLCRRIDIVESRALLLIAGAVLVCTPVIGVTTGWSAYAHDSAVADAQNAARHRVRAELLSDAPTSVPWADETGRPAKVAVQVRWTTAEGVRATGTVSVTPGTERGQRTDVWLNRDGRITAAPLNRSGIWTGALAEGMGSMAVVVGAGAVAGVTVRAACERRRVCGWETEWNQVEPEWSRRKA